MQCPVCGGEAQDATKISTERRGIKCPCCGEYDVSGTVYDTGMLQKLDKDARKRALNKATRSAPPGKRPMITSYDL
jgi:hypothetical protein